MKLNKSWSPAVLIVLSGVFNTINPASAQIATVWQQVTNLPVANWESVAISADGSTLVAAPDNGYVYISTNSGVAWIQTSAQVVTHFAGRDIAVSTNGTVLGVLTTGGVDVSVNSGATWTLRTLPKIYLSCIACSANGTKMAVCAVNGPIYISTNSGTNWTADGPSSTWGDIASSADGTKLVAVDNGTEGAVFQIYTSTDSGVDWEANATANTWQGVASSADGTKLVAGQYMDQNNTYQGYLGSLYTSTDSGTNWTPVPDYSAPALNWISVSSSSDGTHLVAASQPYTPAPGYSVEPGVIYTSTNSGSSWQPSGAPDQFWQVIASSADGNKLIAAGGPTTVDGGYLFGYNGSVYIYTAPSTNAPALSIVAGGGNASVSWPWPSTGFVLQENTNLATTNWVTVPNTPAVVNQVIAPATNANNFYRLANP